MLEFKASADNPIDVYIRLAASRWKAFRGTGYGGGKVISQIPQLDTMYLDLKSIMLNINRTVHK